MKKIFLILFILILCNPLCSASDTNAVYLDLSDTLQEENAAKNNAVTGNIEFNYTPDEREKQHKILIYEDVNHLQPEKKSISKSIEKEVLKDTKVGATYSTSEKSGNLNDSVSLYSKYQKENFGLTTSYTQDRAGYENTGVMGGSVAIAPEIALNKRVTLKNVYSENLTTNKQKSELVLSFRPFKDDRMDFDIGAGQTFSNGNEPAKSQINLGTKIRF